MTFMIDDPAEIQMVRDLFRARVPAISSGIVEIQGIVRDAGYRTILAVVSNDPATDALGACVGNRGSIVKAINAELQGERIDIVLWDDSAKQFVTNLFVPMRFINFSFDDTTHRAKVVLSKDSELHPSRTIALRSRLITQLTGWVLDFEMEK
jgi:N utilization substance protein A